MSTPHISAKSGDFAETVLMPGDPMRAKLIAEDFLSSARLVTDVRGILGYTGTWKNIPVSVMASGMGIPSMGIYSYELYNFYKVENIIRIGSAGAVSSELNLRDLVCALAASTDSNFAHQYALPGTYAPCADFNLLTKAAHEAQCLGINMKAGNILTSDNFYNPPTDSMDRWRDMGIIAVEMECAGLYMTAANAGKRALGICTISDHIYKNESLSSQERQNSFVQMIEVALNTAIALDKPKI